MMRRYQSCREGENPSRTCKLPAGGAVLLVLVGLLAAALIVIYRLSFDKIRTNQTIQTLKEENEALRKNISEQQRCSSCSSCPPPPAVRKETFQKCEPGWEKHGGKCYYFNTMRSSWNDSRRFCIDLGLDLVKIDSREEQMFLETRLLRGHGNRYWIGLTDLEEEGKWFWVDGSPLSKSLSFWMSWEPDDWKWMHPAGEDYAAIGKIDNTDLMGWFDQFCDDPLGSICEI